MYIPQIIQKIYGDYIEGQSPYISLWTQWYRGNVRGFHVYEVWNGEKSVKRKKQQLNMAKRVAEDWKNLLWNDNCSITINGSNNDNLQAFLKEEMFDSKLSAVIENAMALSISGLAVRVCGLEVDEEGNLVGKGAVKLDKFNANNIYPITYENGILTECAFVSKSTRYAHITLHVINKETKNYDLISCSARCFKGGNFNYNESDIQIFHTNSPIKWFSVFYPNIENNINNNSNLPISVFANSISTLEAIDNKYDAFDIEFINGKKIIFVSADMFKTTSDGQLVNTFDSNSLALFALPQNQDGNNKVQEFSSNLRTDALEKALNTEFNILSVKCGFGTNFYSFTQGTATTATAVISMNSDLYRSIRNHEKILTNCINEIIQAIIYANKEFGTVAFAGDIPTKDDIAINFDDSIIIDTEAEKINDRQDVTNGVMSKVEYRQKWFNENESDAIKKLDLDTIARLNDYMPALSSGAMSPKIFVDKCYSYLNENEKAELVAYIETYLGKASDVDDIYNEGIDTDNKMDDNDAFEDDNDTDNEIEVKSKDDLESLKSDLISKKVVKDEIDIKH